MTNQEKKECCFKCFRYEDRTCIDFACDCHSPIDTEKKECPCDDGHAMVSEHLNSCVWNIKGLPGTKQSIPEEAKEVLQHMNDILAVSSPSLETRERESYYAWKKRCHRSRSNEAKYWIHRISTILEEKAKLCEESKEEAKTVKQFMQRSKFNEGIEVAINIIRGTEK